MPQAMFKELVDQVRAQYFPDGSIELLGLEEMSREEMGGFFLQHSNGMRMMTVETETKVAILGKAAEKLFVKVSVPTNTYNIGILNNVARKVFNEIKNNAIKTTK